MAERIDWISNEPWGQYVTCLLLHLLLPLLPLLFEAMVSDVKATTLAISAAMYAMGVGLSSKNAAQFAGCIMIGFIFSFMFGLASTGNVNAFYVKISSALSMLVVFTVHATERYNRHVVDCIPFFEFAKGER